MQGDKAEDMGRPKCGLRTAHNVVGCEIEDGRGSAAWVKQILEGFGDKGVGAAVMHGEDNQFAACGESKVKCLKCRVEWGGWSWAGCIFKLLVRVRRWLRAWVSRVLQEFGCDVRFADIARIPV